MTYYNQFDCHDLYDWQVTTISDIKEEAGYSEEIPEKPEDVYCPRCWDRSANCNYCRTE
jgi:hypothetical protein